MNVTPIVLCGGIGGRLSPFSSRALPKQFIVFFTDGESFFQKTIRRIRKIFKVEKIIIVANKINQELVLQQLQDIGEKNVLLLLEHYHKNTFLSLAAVRTVMTDDVGLLAVFPSDHFILDEKNFRKDVLSALNVSLKEGRHILFGIKPNRIDDNYGYIQIGDQINVDCKHDDFFEVKSFIEKPSKRVAERKINSDKCFWNSGIFVFNKKKLAYDIKAFENKNGNIYDYIAIKKADDTLMNVFARCTIAPLPDVSIDEAIIEKNKDLLCKKAKFGWRDVGNFASLHELMEKNYIHFSIPEYIEQCNKYSHNKAVKR